MSRKAALNTAPTSREDEIVLARVEVAIAHSRGRLPLLLIFDSDDLARRAGVAIARRKARHLTALSRDAFERWLSEARSGGSAPTQSPAKPPVGKGSAGKGRKKG